MMQTKYYLRGLALCAILSMGSIPTAGAHEGEHGTPEKTPGQNGLPTDAASWINSPPMSMEMLKGKAAVFYCFEET